MQKLKSLIIAFFIFFLQLVAASPLPVEPKNSGEILLALKKLQVLGSALYIAAHPDDENTAVLAYLAKEKLVRTGYLSLTRGSGGQNLIGSEKGNPLGIIRTQELLAARKIDGAEQFFTRAIDFGYSKTSEETLEIWNKEEILADIVWVIRSFRPDVIITRFTPKLGGHGHHLASAILAEEAFHAAADPSHFPDQLQHRTLWQAKRLVWNTFNPPEPQPLGESVKPIKINVGAFNSILGLSYTEIAAKSRSMHKCQGFGASPLRSSKFEYFEHILGEPAANDLFDFVDLGWSRIPGGKEVSQLLGNAIAKFNLAAPSEIVSDLLKVYKKIEQMASGYLIDQKKEKIKELLLSCSGLWIESTADRFSVSPGENLKVSTRVINRSPSSVSLETILLPNTKEPISIHHNLVQYQEFAETHIIGIPMKLKISQPYWLEKPPFLGHYQVNNPLKIGSPQETSLDPVKIALSFQNEIVHFETPILYRWTDPIQGEIYRNIEILPPISVKVEEELLLFPSEHPKQIHLSISHNQSSDLDILTIQPPSGWIVNPDKIRLEQSMQDGIQRETITVTPPAAASLSKKLLSFNHQGIKTKHARSHKEISYPHIPIQGYFPRAQSTVVRIDVKTRKKTIAYIEGSGDEIPKVLEQLGYKVTVLTDGDLAKEELAKFDTIITGIRAYNTRKALAKNFERLLDYIQAGGTVVDQYNKNSGLLIEHLGPYPFRISKDRVTDENAPVTVLIPDHSLLTTPNTITRLDFNQWIQERGTYFADQWDSKYETLLSSHDSNENPKKGGLLFCNYGQGFYIYTGYSWFRQLPTGNPGAIRLFVNLIEAGGKK